jgi:hypothetical protein
MGMDPIASSAAAGGGSSSSYQRIIAPPRRLVVETPAYAHQCVVVDRPGQRRSARLLTRHRGLARLGLPNQVIIEDFMLRIYTATMLATLCRRKRPRPICRAFGRGYPFSALGDRSRLLAP